MTSDGVIKMDFGIEEVENVPLTFAHRARIVSELREVLAGAQEGAIVYEDQEGTIAELEEIIEIVNTPRGA